MRTRLLNAIRSRFLVTGTTDSEASLANKSNRNPKPIEATGAWPAVRRRSEFFNVGFVIGGVRDEKGVSLEPPRATHSSSSQSSTYDEDRWPAKIAVHGADSRESHGIQAAE